MLRDSVMKKQQRDRDTLYAYLCVPDSWQRAEQVLKHTWACQLSDSVRKK